MSHILAKSNNWNHLYFREFSAQAPISIYPNPTPKAFPAADSEHCAQDSPLAFALWPLCFVAYLKVNAKEDTLLGL